jgi:dolichol kinase
MNIAAQLFMVVASVALLLMVMAGVHHLGRRYNWNAELQRKCVHVATGLYALTLPYLYSERWPVAVLIGSAIAVMLVLRLKALTKDGIGTAVHGVKRTSYGDLLLAIAIGLIFFRTSPDQPALYVLPIAVLTLSDAVAAMVGVSYGRYRFKVEQDVKSLEGTVMFFLVTWILAFIILLLMTRIGRANVVLLGGLIAAFAAMVEAESWRGFDNLFVPIGVHLFLANYSGASPLALLMLAIGFAGAVGVVLLVAPRVRLTAHAGRSLVIFLFLLLSVTEVQNAVLAVTAMIAHLYARSVRPCQSDWPDLDFIALATGICLFWLFIGEQLNKSAANVFNLTFADFAAVLVVITLRRQRAFWGTLVVGGLGAAVFVIAHYNQLRYPYSYWHGDFLPWIVAALGLSVVIASFKPDAFDRWRGPRAGLVALLIPFGMYASKTVML